MAGLIGRPSNGDRVLDATIKAELYDKVLDNIDAVKRRLERSQDSSSARSWIILQDARKQAQNLLNSINAIDEYLTNAIAKSGPLGAVDQEERE